MIFRARKQRAARWVGAALIVAVVVSLPMWAAAELPAHLRLVPDQSHQLRWLVPLPVTIRVPEGGRLALNGTEVGQAAARVRAARALQVAPRGLGAVKLDFRLFGWIPLRKMTVDVVPPLQLIPGGHSIGVMVRSQGIMAVGFGAVATDSRQSRLPARDSGLEIGDLIVKINGEEVVGEGQAADLIDQAGRQGVPIYFELRRQGQTVNKVVEPVLDAETGRWRVGLYIRDGAMGIGTLTFYDPASGRYGALGHVIADTETNSPIGVRDGHIVPAAVSAIEPGVNGRPGEKIGIPADESRSIGSIESNTRFGIFGRLQMPLQNPLFPAPVPVGLGAAVHPGPAEMLTVITDHKLERFKVEILRVNTASDAAGRNLIIRVADQRLLDRTGGIVQGMSGSPILQDGRLVGAVTHVFVNDPTRGYGVLMEWMLQEAGLLPTISVGAAAFAAAA